MTGTEMSDVRRSRVRRTMRLRAVLCWVILLTFSGASFAGAQSPATALPDAPVAQGGDRDAVTIRNTPVHVLQDQLAIWTSPAHIRKGDLIWMVPLAAGIGAGIATDHHVLSSLVSHDEDFNNANIDASNAMIDGLIAAPVVLYGVGHLRGNEHARETGILTGEALVDSLVVEQGMKLVFWRERPTTDDAHGRFFQGSAGPDSSFPSSHSMLAWSAAAAMAEEYRSPWVQAGLYSLATGVSLTRVLGQEHFPTDVLVGSATGWLIGHYVVHRRHRHDALQH
jgi:hypothetical protein